MKEEIYNLIYKYVNRIDVQQSLKKEIEQYANQRVIEELKLLRLQAHVHYEGDGFDEFRKIDVEDIDSRIKELKQ